MSKRCGHFTWEYIQMAQKHMERSQYHLSLGKCKMKQQWDTTTPIRRLKSKKTGINKQYYTGKDVKQNTNSLVIVLNGITTLEDSLALSYRAKHSLNKQLSNYALFIYPIELKTYVHTTTYTGIFTAILFIIAKTWKHPRCPLMVNE